MYFTSGSDRAFEQPQPRPEQPDEAAPGLENSVLENPTSDNPTPGNPTLENPMQLNKDISSKEKTTTDVSITDSIPILSRPFPSEDEAAQRPQDHPYCRGRLPGRAGEIQVYEAGQLSHRVCYDIIGNYPKRRARRCQSLCVRRSFFLCLPHWEVRQFFQQFQNKVLLHIFVNGQLVDHGGVVFDHFLFSP